MLRSDKLRAGKFDVDAPLVERLVARQFPHWAGLAVAPVAEDGWDNWTFRLGDSLKVRLPSAAAYAGQAEKEARWLPRLAPHLPVAVPVPRALGAPGPDYPWPWSVLDWLEGEPASPATVPDPMAFAADIAAFLNALWAIDATGGPPPGAHNFHRGADPVAVYGEEARRAIDAIAGRIDAPAAHALLDRAAAVPHAGPPVWVHGDIAAGNLLVRDGRLAAVIDFGSSAVGDPACDLVIAWVYFTGPARAAFRAALPADEPTWLRARAWALWKAALVTAANAPTNPAETAPLAVIDAVLREMP